MANVLVAADAYIGQRCEVQVDGRAGALPVRVVDSGTIAPTWAQVLASGRFSGTTNPQIGSGGVLEFAATATITALSGSVRLRVGGATYLSVANTVVGVVPPLLEFSNAAGMTVYHNGTAGQPITIVAATNPTGNGGALYLRGGDGGSGSGEYGGDVWLVPGDNLDPSAVGGNVYVANGDEQVVIQISSSGIRFYDGVPAQRPVVTGSRGGNAALASLLTALDNIGFIDNNTTA
jgi:hypothetical protein